MELKCSLLLFYRNYLGSTCFTWDLTIVLAKFSMPRRISDVVLFSMIILGIVDMAWATEQFSVDWHQILCAVTFHQMHSLEMFLIRFLRWLISSTCKYFHFNEGRSVLFVPPFFSNCLVVCRNLGHNQLNGQLSDMFGKLPKLATL